MSDQPTNSVMLLTAPGVSAIAGIRLRGPEAEPFLRQHFTATPRPGAAVHGRLVDAEHVLDDPVVIWDEPGATADIFCHGGRWVVRSILDLAQREGFTVLTGMPAEAFDGADLHRDVLQFLPRARTREAIATLLAQEDAWGHLTEASAIRAAIEDRSLYWLLNPPKVAIIGAPNAGKSTLANALLGQQLSIVADLPGTTRDYVEAFANVGGLPVTLVDTPGLRQSGDLLEMAAIGLSADQIAAADLRIVLLDPTQDAQLQEPLLGRYPDAIVVSGKCDIRHGELGLAISAHSGEGIPELERKIRERFACAQLPHTRPCAWTARQQAELVARLLAAEATAP